MDTMWYMLLCCFSLCMFEEVMLSPLVQSRQDFLRKLKVVNVIGHIVKRPSRSYVEGFVSIDI